MLATLWTRDDVTDSVVDFLPTKSIAVLPIVAKPLRAAQQRVLLTAVRRRGKTVPSPPTTRAFLDTLCIGEPRYFKEDWEGGLEQWSEKGGHGNTMTEYTVKPFRGGGQCLEIFKDISSVDMHRGLITRTNKTRHDLVVTRFRVTLSYTEIVLFDGSDSDSPPADGAVGYVILGNKDDSSHFSDIDFWCGPRIDRGELGSSLMWFSSEQGGTRRLCTATPNTLYTVDAVFTLDPTTDRDSVSVSVNGQLIVPGLISPPNRRLVFAHVYNYSPGTSEIGRIEVWSKVAAPVETHSF